MHNKKIKISEEFSDAPGARYKSDGPFSGEEFLEECLLPAFKEAVQKSGKVTIDLDDTWGYASSFLSGSFGELSKKYGKEKVKDHLDLISNDEPILINKIEAEIDNPE